MWCVYVCAIIACDGMMMNAFHFYYFELLKLLLSKLLQPFATGDE
jgi:hypothetical protein